MFVCLFVCQVEATDKTAIINISFSVGSAAEDLSRKLQGVTVKIKGVKLHAFVRVRKSKETPSFSSRMQFFSSAFRKINFLGSR